MGRPPRIDLADYVYHVINRSNGRVPIFHNDPDYRDFEYLLNEIRETFDMRILAYAIMPNHWHLLLYPIRDGSISKAMQWLGTSHAHRHHARYGTIGSGHLYQGRYKSFLTQDDRHLLAVMKYIERNPARAKLVKKAEDWRWGSAYRRIHGTTKERQLLAESPTSLPRNYTAWINDPETSEDLDDIRKAIATGSPYGDVRIL